MLSNLNFRATVLSLVMLVVFLGVWQLATAPEVLAAGAKPC